MKAWVLLVATLLATISIAEEADPPPMQLPQVEYTSATDIGLLARVHFATHTPDFDRARAFYRGLGYTEGFANFPLTNTHLVARALGMFDICQYELADGEVIALPGNPGANIDLLQFKVPFNGDPPYELPNHLGMAYAGFTSTDFSGDVERLKQLGARFLGPIGTDSGGQFVFFKDVDGVMYRLEAAEGKPSETMQIVDMPYVAVNVSNIEASLNFYAKFGYQPVGPIEVEEADATAGQAYGFADGFRRKMVNIAIERGDRHVLKMTQWITPFDPEPAYPPPINHIGINRIALVVPDVDRAVSILKAQDVPFLSEPAPCCSGQGNDTTAIVHAIDPDGVFLELVGATEPKPLEPVPEGCPPLEIIRRD